MSGRIRDLVFKIYSDNNDAEKIYYGLSGLVSERPFRNTGSRRRLHVSQRDAGQALRNSRCWWRFPIFQRVSKSHCCLSVGIGGEEAHSGPLEARLRMAETPSAMA